MSYSEFAWSGARALLGAAEIRPTCLADLFEVPLSILEATLTICAAELSEDGARGSYERALKDWSRTSDEPSPIIRSAAVFATFLPACVGLAVSRQLLLSNRPLDAYFAADGAIDGHRTSLRAAVEELDALLPTSPAPTDESSLDFFRDDWYWFLPPDHPEALANQRQIRSIQSSLPSDDPLEAAGALVVAARELRFIAMLVEQVGEVEPYLLATSHSPGSPFDFQALVDWSRFWALDQIGVAFGEVSSFALLQAAPPSLAVGLEMARRLMDDGLLAPTRQLLDRLQGDAFEFEEEAERLSQRLRLTTMRARLAKQQGNPAEAFAELTAFFDDLPLGVAFQLSLGSSTEYEEAQRLLAYLEGWRDALKDQLGAEELREQFAQIQRLLLASRTREIQHGESLSVMQSSIELIREDQQAQSTILLELPSQVTASLREDLGLETELIGRLFSETLAVREWSRVADDVMHRMGSTAAEDRLSRRFGETWLTLTREARQSLLALQVLELHYDPALAPLGLVGLVGTFEAELRATLVNHHVVLPPSAMLRDFVVAAASQPSGRLKEVGTMCLEAKVLELRNDAAHGRNVSDADYQRAKEIILRVGSGLLWKLVSE